MSFMAFQKAAQLSADKQRTVVESVKIAVDEDNAQSVYRENLIRKVIPSTYMSTGC
jgi:hypothetical protein